MEEEDSAVVVEEEDSAVEEEVEEAAVEEVEEVLVEDHQKEVGVDLQHLATLMATTEGRKHVKMYTMKKSVK